MTFWNGVSDHELYFFYETCDITDYIHVKAWWILSCFLLIYSSFFLHIQNIIELRRAKEFRFIRLNATG